MVLTTTAMRAPMAPWGGSLQILPRTTTLEVAGTPTSYVEAFDSTGNATPSLDGASLKLTQTSSQTVHQTNVLWPFIAGPLRHLHVLPYGHPGVSELQLQRSQRIG